MKIAAIYNAWDGIELLAGSINCIKKHVNAIIIVWQDRSNWGEEYNPLNDIHTAIDAAGLRTISKGPEIILAKYTPTHLAGFSNEINKRNLGLEFARGAECTHFLFMDCDEYYKDFAAAKAEYISTGRSGSVCPIITYFKHATLQCDQPDGYYVPFIHRLQDNTTAGVREYPYYVDPTRRVNDKDIAVLSHQMHHFSYVRADIGRKIRNSSARNNIAAGTIMKDYNLLSGNIEAAGFYVRDMDRRLVVVEDYFKIGI